MPPIAKGNATRTADKARRGGARHDRNRLTYELTERQCRDLLQAVMTASIMGMPFNRWITIAWGRNGAEPRDNRNMTGRWLKLASDWMRRHRHKLVWAYVQEASDRNGAHVHILLHVPPYLDPLWRNMPRAWVVRVLGRQPVRNTLVSRKHSTGGDSSDDRAAYQAWVLGKAHYMLKAAPRALEAALEVQGMGYKPWGVPCAVYGVRLSIWQGWKRHAPAATG